MRRMDGLEALYRGRLNEFVRVATAIAGDRERGLDAVQDAFTSAVRKRHRFRGEGTLEAWVWRIVVNAARDAARRAKPTAPMDDVPAVDARSARLPLHLLTDRQREVLFLHYYADLDYSTIGAALEISPGTVGATLSAARRTLRGALQKEVAS
jgi:DNA-directed RNA polymerase specialized sigma24 family protein